MYGYIYKTTNKLNGYIYIGQHTNHYVRRYNKIDPNYFGSGKIIQKILKKYSKTVLSCEIIEWCDSPEDLDKKEIYYINIFKDKYKDKCYNIAEGGNKNKIRFKSAKERAEIKRRELNTKNNKSEEEKKKLADRIRNTLLNKSPEEKARIAKKHSDTWFNKPVAERMLREENRLNTRKNWSVEQAQKNSEACRKAKEKPVIITDGINYIEFNSALECSRKLGWYDCAAGMYIRKYNGKICKRKSKYYGWKIAYKK